MARLILLILFLSNSLSLRADLNAADNALARGEYEQAAAEFTRLAEQGDDRAQANLGYMYYTGEGVPQSYEQAVLWYQKAAVQGNRDAQYNLAVSYAFGEGVKQDLTEAAVWYRRAGEQGHVISQYSLGISYAYGEGVPQDQAEAGRWFKKAAEQGYARAQVHLGSLYHTGEGVEQDYQAAARWYRMAADRGDATAQYNLGTMYRSGKGLQQDYAQAKRWFRQAADQGYAAAQNELASLERTSATGIAARTVQSKPGISPDEKKTVVTNTAPANTPATAAESEQRSKQPLLSIDKKDFLSLDKAQPDIDEPVNTVIPEVKEDSASEDVAETQPPPDDGNIINRALGIPDAPKAEQAESSGGFFSRLFSSSADETEQPSDTVAVGPDQSTPAQPDAQTTEVSTQAAAATASERVTPTKTDSEPEPERADGAAHGGQQASAQTESSGGFFSRLFSSSADETEQPSDPVAVGPDQSTPAQPGEQTTEASTQAAAATASERVTPTKTDGEPEPERADGAAHGGQQASAQTESSGGFFSRLFSSSADETEQPSDPVAVGPDQSTPAQPGEQTTEASTQAAAATAPERVTPNTASKTDGEPEPERADGAAHSGQQTSAQTESSGGFFSRLFSSSTDETEPGETEPGPGENSITAAEDEARLIAKADGTAAKIEDIEIASRAEADLTHYSVDAGRRALAGNNFEEAVNQFRPLAEAGDSEAQAHLGSLYYVGKGVNRDLNEAYNWYKKSADQGNVDAQYSIGNMYLLGEGVEQNNTEAAKWYSLAGEQGHAAAGNNLENLKKLESINREHQLPREQPPQDSAAVETAETPQDDKNASHNTSDMTEPQNDNTTDSPKGFFARLFSSDDSDDGEDGLDSSASVQAEQQAITSTRQDSAEEPVDTSTTATATESPGFFNSLFDSEAVDTGDDKIAVTEVGRENSPATETAPKVAEPAEETLQTNEVVAAVTVEPKAEQTESSGGFFSRLFSSSADETEQPSDPVAVGPDPSTPAQPGEQTTEVSTQAATATEPEGVTPNTASKTDGEPEPERADSATHSGQQASEQTEESGGLLGFFGKLFSSDTTPAVNDAPTEIALNEQAVNDVSEPVLEETANDVSEPALEETVNDVSEPAIEETAKVRVADNIRLSATRGDREAQYKLGTMYYSGENIKQDYTQALLWYRRAAQQGNVDAQYDLGNMFLLGEGIEQDDQQAAYWYTLAADQGHESAKKNLANLQKTLSPEFDKEALTAGNDRLMDLDTAENKRIEERDDGGRKEYELGLAYAFGDGVAQDDRHAFKLFLAAAEQGYALAQYKAGVCYAYGEGVRQDLNQAVEWYRRAAEQGYTIAQRNLAMMYLNGTGIRQDKVQALAWYQIVANSGNAMDIHRRDLLQKELSNVELSQSEAIAEQIISKLNSNTSL